MGAEHPGVRSAERWEPGSHLWQGGAGVTLASAVGWTDPGITWEMASHACDGYLDCNADEKACPLCLALALAAPTDSMYRKWEVYLCGVNWVWTQCEQLLQTPATPESSPWWPVHLSCSQNKPFLPKVAIPRAFYHSLRRRDYDSRLERRAREDLSLCICFHTHRW